MATRKTPTHVVLERSSGPAELIGVRSPMKGIAWDDALPDMKEQLLHVAGDITRMTLLYSNGGYVSFDVAGCPKPLHGACWGGLGSRVDRRLPAPMQHLPADDPTYTACYMAYSIQPDVCYPIDGAWWCPTGKRC